MIISYILIYKYYCKNKNNENINVEYELLFNNYGTL